MMGSAQLEMLPAEANDGAGFGEAAAGVAPAALKQQVLERLAAHRQRRGESPGGSEPRKDEMQKGHRKHRIVAAIAERYAHTPSYRALLAEEAERAIQQASAAAEVAARNAEAVVTSQRELLAELAMWTAPQEFTAETAQAAHGLDVPVKQVSAGGLTVRLYEDLGRSMSSASELSAPRQEHVTASSGTWEEAEALDEEIAFRQAPAFEEHVWKHEPAVPLAANLLEFPRQLVAARKVRPRLAEGPLRDDPNAHSPQLRIFEVRAEQVSSAPAPTSSLPEWSSIWLDAHTAAAPVEHQDMTLAEMSSSLAPQTASLQLRAMAATVDGLLVVSGLVAFVAVLGQVAPELPTGIPAAIVLGVALVTLYVVYQGLFFTFAEQTPGMRYARIGLCTFSDANPSRSSMRRRILAKGVSMCPLGLGVLWALLDDDRLGWHDRISNMYLRAY